MNVLILIRIVCMLEVLCSRKVYTNILFIDVSSTFNTLKPDIMINKLRTLNVSPILCSLFWVS